jgi:dihydroxyacetone kinase-like predicted kinase
MTAEQVKQLCEDKKIQVVPTRSVMQAISALIAYNDEGDISQISLAMNHEVRIHHL